MFTHRSRSLVRFALAAGGLATAGVVAAPLPATALPRAATAMTQGTVTARTDIATTSTDPADDATWDLQARLVQYADEATALAGPAYFADVRINLDTARVEVALAGAPDALKALIDAAHPGYYLFAAAAHPQAELLAAQAAISAEYATLQTQGVDLRYLMPTWDGYLEVGVASPTTAAAAALARFGADLIRVVGDDRPTQLVTYRYADSAPWNGGDFIFNSGKGNCSAGIPIHGTTTGHDYMLTAAHCFSANGTVGTAVHNGWIDAGTVHGSNAAIASVTYSDTATSGTSMDSALMYVPAGTSAVDFVCAWNCQGRAFQAGVASNVKGAQVCASGAFEGQVCSVVISATNLTLANDLGGMTSNLVEGSQSSGVVAIGAGDSGGPVYSYTGAKLLAQGMIDGSRSAVKACPAGTPRASVRSCFSTFVWVDMKALDAHWGIAPNLG